MASYEIPETVLGIPLFVPDGHDYFSVDVGGMPNGDDCLVVHGDVSTDYKAFQQLPASNFFSDRRVAADFSINFWMKSTTTTVSGTGSNFRTNGTIFAPMSALAASVYDYYYTAPNWSPVYDVPWSVCHWSNTSNTIGFIRQTGYRGSSSGGGRSVYCTGTLPEDTWTMVTILVPAWASPQDAASLYFNNSATPESSAASNGSYNSDIQAIQALSNPKFCIGSYSNGNNMGSRSGEYRLGKLAFFDHLLDQTERSVLYTTMVGA